MAVPMQVPDTGMDLRDLLDDTEFQRRQKRPNDLDRGLEAIRRLAYVFAKSPQRVLQELVNIAVEVCEADSAGISLEEKDEAGEIRFRWVAIAGTFARYVNGITPRFFSPCGTCLDAERPQLYRATKAYYDFLGVEAEPITDGMLIPWTNDFARGTIWAVSHNSGEAFNFEDYKLLKVLADFASIAIWQERREQRKLQRARGAAYGERSHEMAHLINNPLQSLTNTIYLAQQGGPDAQMYLERAADELATLSGMVAKLLALREPISHAAGGSPYDVPSLQRSALLEPDKKSARASFRERTESRLKAR